MYTRLDYVQSTVTEYQKTTECNKYVLIILADTWSAQRSFFQFFNYPIIQLEVICGFHFSDCLNTWKQIYIKLYNNIKFMYNTYSIWLFSTKYNILAYLDFHRVFWWFPDQLIFVAHLVFDKDQIEGYEFPFWGNVTK